MKPILDGSGRVLAYAHKVNEYREEIRSRSNGLLGWCNPKTGKTHDRRGNVISNSRDIRAKLIPPSR